MTPKRSSETDAILTTLVAPCGMNCRLCYAYMRDKKPCPGCRGDDTGKPKTRVMCRIKNCEKLVQGNANYCIACDSYPCARLKHLDERYRTKYGMSMIDNLKNIKESGIKCFIESEQVRWACPECGEKICVHKPQCISCGYKWH